MRLHNAHGCLVGRCGYVSSAYKVNTTVDVKMWQIYVDMYAVCIVMCSYSQVHVPSYLFTLSVSREHPAYLIARRERKCAENYNK